MYTEIKVNGILVGIRNSDNGTIPLTTDNRDYVKYLEWVNEGNTPEEENTIKEELF